MVTPPPPPKSQVLITIIPTVPIHMKCLEQTNLETGGRLAAARAQGRGK